ISLYNQEAEVLITGDLFHRDDVGWLNIFREGVSAINRSIESLQHLQQLSIKEAYSGHGPKIDNPKQSIQRAIDRFERWVENPKRIGWHACKRVYAYTLIIENGMHKDDIEEYLLGCPGYHDFSRYIFQESPEQYVESLINEVIRSHAAEWKGDMLMATAPYDIADPSWMKQNIKPEDWHQIYSFESQS